MTAPPLVRDDDPDRAMTTAEAAALLGVGKRTLLRRVDEGAIPTVRVGRCLRFRRSDLVRFLAANTTTTR
jgi:excisionase family DNA binding protein